LYLIPPSLGLSQRLLNRDHDQVYYAGCPVGPRGEALRRHGDRITRLHGGFYRAAGRADDTMNLGGIKVGSLEIEQILETHEMIRESAAVGMQVGGEAAERLVIFVQLDRGRDPDQLRQELASLLARRLNPLFKIHDLVVVPDLPRTVSNKLMRRVLREQYQAGRRPPEE
jgi:acetyl-CoA synthetase